MVVRKGRIPSGIRTPVTGPLKSLATVCKKSKGGEVAVWYLYIQKTSHYLIGSLNSVPHWSGRRRADKTGIDRGAVRTCRFVEPLIPRSRTRDGVPGGVPQASVRGPGRGEPIFRCVRVRVMLRASGENVFPRGKIGK